MDRREEIVSLQQQIIRELNRSMRQVGEDLWSMNKDLTADRKKILADDANNHDAYMGLMRLALQKGDYAEAMKCLELATKNAKGAESSGFDKALLSMMKNDLARICFMVTSFCSVSVRL